MRQSRWVVALAVYVLCRCGIGTDADDNAAVYSNRPVPPDLCSRDGEVSRDRALPCLACARQLDVDPVDCCTDALVYTACVELLDDAIQSGSVPESTDGDNSIWVDANAEDDYEEMSKRRSPFIGKRRSPFIGKRRSPFIGKRRSPFLGKRRSPFLGKRRSPFLGKRGSEEDDLDWQTEKRRSPFLG